MDKEITQIQIAWFFSSVYMGNFEDFSLKLKIKLGESKVTQHLPIPIDMPNEIPRLILSYPNFNLNVAKNRLDLFLKDIKSIKSVVYNINDVVFNELTLPVGRIGFVKTFFVNGNIDDLKKLLNKEKVQNLNLKEISIRVNENKKIESYNCNNVENLSIGFVVKKEIDGREVKKQGIIATRDLNTIAEEISENKFDKELIVKMIDAFDTESSKFIFTNFE